MEDLFFQFIMDAPFRYPFSFLGIIILIAGFILHYLYGSFRWLMMLGLVIIILGVILGEARKRK